jgi:type IV secretion system protein VirB10
MIKALAVVAFFAVSTQAIAACLSHNPIDPACRNYDFLSDSFANVVVMPQGARVFGTIQHSLTNGLDRLAVLWQNITTPVLYDGRGMPHQFRVAVNSPASSELGETGLDGDVDHHYVKKIGGILGLSLIQGAIQYGVAKAQNQGQGNTTLNLDSFQSGGNDAANELLRAWINIPDVMTRNQGTACGIYVVRDLDMRGAYKLTKMYRN